MSIVEEIRSNPEEGARRLEREYKPGLLALAQRLCTDQGDAEELVNRTIAVAVTNIDSLASQSALFGWMSQILVGCHAKDVRRKSNDEIVYSDAVPDVADESAEEEIYRNLDHSLLREAVRRLPSEDREVLLLHYFMDIPIAKMAKILAVPIGTVKSRLHYARKVLAAKLGAAVKKPGGKALLIALVLAAFAAVGAAGIAAIRAALSTEKTGKTVVSVPVAAPAASAAEPVVSNAAPAVADAVPAVSNVATSTSNIQQEQPMNTKTRTTILAAAALAATGAVTARADSINNYVVLQYLESSGTQAIDTGVKYGPTTRMKFRMQVLNGATGGQIGAIDKLGTDDKYDRFHFNVNNGLMRVWCDRQDEGCPSASSEGGTWHDYDINLVDNKVYRDGTQDISAANNPGYVGTMNNHSTIWIFGRNGSTPSLKQYATVRLGNVEIWQDGQLDSPTRRLFPCMRLSDNVLGMYDTVNNEFLTNVGTGTFKAGPGAINYDEIPPQIFNDEPVCPEVVVKAGVQRLVKDTDYTLAWTNNTATGLGKVTVTPIGSYADCAAFAIQFWIVPPEKKLPSEYQRIVYLESTPDGNQQLDTLVHPNGNMRVEVRFQSPDPNKMGMIGMIDNPPVERFHLGRSTDNGGIFGGLGSQYTSGGLSYSTLVGINWATMAAWTCLENNVPCGWFSVNGANAQKVTDIGTFNANNSTFGLFGRLSNSNDLKSYVAYRVMYMEVKEGDAQVQTHRFVPCRRLADGELGVYDTVARRFLYDTGREARGAEVFQAGPDVVTRQLGFVVILH